MFKYKVILLFLVVFFITSSSLVAYSILTHEALIDAAWEKTIAPALTAKYPHNSSAEELKKAKAFAYGGAIMPDMGYYPFGKKMFTNLVHYARSGDFVVELIRQSSNINEYAFALGALAHYTADNNGHSLGVNTSVPLLFGYLKRMYGDTITYEENHMAHKRAEFSFDIIQVSRSAYATEDYHQFIGFEISEDLMKKAFATTYGFSLTYLVSDFPLAVNTFRWSIQKGFPLIVRAAYKANKKKIKKEDQSLNKYKQNSNFDELTYRKNWGNRYKKPGVPSAFATGLVFIIPKVGPFKVLKIMLPTPETEKKFEDSFTKSYSVYQGYVKELVTTNSLTLANKDFDTGNLSHCGEYCLADEAYLYLIKKLKKENYTGMTKELKENIVLYFSNVSSIKKPQISVVKELSIITVK